MFSNAKKAYRAVSVLWKKNPDPKPKTLAELKDFCKKELASLEPKGIDFKDIVEVPKPKIGCVAGEILKDLALENCAKWSYNWENALWTHYYLLKMEGKQYELRLVYKDYLYGRHEDKGRYNVYLSGFSEFSFNDDEQKEISHAFEKIQDNKMELTKQKNLKSEAEVLNKLFPACAPAKNGVEFLE